MQLRAIRAISLGGILLLGAQWTACTSATPGDEVDEATGPSVRDSSGVRIVENGTITDASWTVRPEPLFTVGWEEGGPNFTWPQSGRVLPDGGAVVGEFGEGTIFHIGADGTVLETWGRKGEGPGEYQGLDAILLKGDSLLVSDIRLRRVTVVSPDGSVRTSPYPAGVPLHNAAGILADDALLFVPAKAYGPTAEVRPEWVFRTQPILVTTPDWSSVDTIAELPHLRQWAGTRGGAPGVLPVWGRASGFSSGFAWARADERSVRWYDGEGRLSQIAHWDEAPSPLSRDGRARMRQAYEELFSSRGPDFVSAQLVQLQEWLDRHEGPLPYWREFHVDRLGNAWLSSYSLLGRAPERWRVITRDGALKGWVEMPGVITVLDITDDRVLVVRHDELDVPAVIMLALLKP